MRSIRLSTLFTYTINHDKSSWYTTPPPPHTTSKLQPPISYKGAEGVWARSHRKSRKTDGDNGNYNNKDTRNWKDVVSNTPRRRNNTHPKYLSTSTRTRTTDTNAPPQPNLNPGKKKTPQWLKNILTIPQTTQWEDETKYHRPITQTTTTTTTTAAEWESNNQQTTEINVNLTIDETYNTTTTNWQNYPTTKLDESELQHTLDNRENYNESNNINEVTKNGDDSIQNPSLNYRSMPFVPQTGNEKYQPPITSLNPNAANFSMPPTPMYTYIPVPDNNTPPDFHYTPNHHNNTHENNNNATLMPQRPHLSIDTTWYPPPNSPCPMFEQEKYTNENTIGSPPDSPAPYFSTNNDSFDSCSAHENDCQSCQTNNTTIASQELNSPHPPKQPTNVIPHKTTHNKNNKKLLSPILTQNIQGDFTTESKSIINQMQTHGWHAACLQETWALGDDFDYTREEFHIFQHNIKEKSGKQGHVQGGVAIILNHNYHQAYLNARKKGMEIHTTPKGKFQGRALGLPLSFPNIDDYGKQIQGTLDFYLYSIYHPVDTKEHQEFTHTLTSIFARIPTNSNGEPKYEILIGADINCNVGIRSTTDPNEYRSVLGTHGLDNRNIKGKNYLPFLSEQKLKITNSFFTKPNYTTWTSFNESRTQHMLDVFLCTSNAFKRVRDCEAKPIGAKSDHTGVLLTLHLNTIAYNADQHTTIDGGEIDWATISTKEGREKFNELQKQLSPQNQPDYTAWFETLNIAARATAIKPRHQSPDWFVQSQEKLQPIIQNMLDTLDKWKKATPEEAPTLKLKLKNQSKMRDIAIEQAKADYSRNMAERCEQLNKTGWQAFRELELGDNSNYKKKKSMSLALPNGERATTDKQNMSVFLPHANAIFNNTKIISPEALKFVVEREQSTELDNNITRQEFTRAVNGLKNDKSPGANGIPAEAFKYLDEDNLDKVYQFIVDFWEGDVDYDEWHEGSGVPVPKTNDPTDPNKYRIVNLMDVGSKIFSRILTARAFKLLSKGGTKFQFGGVPKAGCADANFTLKTILHLRHQHNLDTYVVFADLIKAFDTADHALLIKVLERYGAPPKFRNAISRLYDNLKVILRIGKESAELSQTVGVRQGDNLSPVIFLFLMAAFSETVEAEWDLAGIPKAAFSKPPSDTNLLNGQLTGHLPANFDSGDIFQVIQVLFVDDGAFVFGSREDMTRGLEVINDSFKRLGLEMHLGRDGKASKSEGMYIPKPSFFRETQANSLPYQTHNQPNPAGDPANSLPHQTHNPPNTTNPETHQTTDLTAHNNNVRMMPSPSAARLPSSTPTTHNANDRMMPSPSEARLPSSSRNQEPHRATNNPTLTNLATQKTTNSTAHTTQTTHPHAHATNNRMMPSPSAARLSSSPATPRTQAPQTHNIPHRPNSPEERQYDAIPLGSPLVIITSQNPADDTIDEEGNALPTPTNSLNTNKPPKKTKQPTKAKMARKRREAKYQASPQTDRIHTSAGYIDFTMYFQYLGSFISFDLRDDYDTEQRISSASQAMGALKHFWRNPYVDLRTKVSIFKAIPLNLLLWGCETWALRESLLDTLDVFLHRSIRRILGITITQVQDEHIKNSSIRKTFHNIPDIRNQIAIRQTSFLGKVVRAPDQHPPKQLLAAWCNHPRPIGGPLMTNKKSMVKSLHLLLPAEMTEPKQVRNRVTKEMEIKQVLNKDGKTSLWINIALDTALWEWHIEKLRQPGVEIPPPDPNRRSSNTSSTPPPSPNNNNPPPSPPPRRNNAPSTPPRRRPNNHAPPSPRSNHTSTNYDPELVNSNKNHALRALGLPRNATEREVRTKFRRLSMIYHPDKYSPALGISQEEATAHFQTINNANEYLRSLPL